jgi:O-antigen/teichoic acid export membrane protein
MIFTFTGAILNIILNYLLIPKFSFNGAAVATVTAELVVGILMVMNIHNIRNLSFILSNVIFKCLAAGSLMAMFLTFFLDFNLIPLILFAAVIYFIALYVIRGFEKEDINLFKQVLGR